MDLGRGKPVEVRNGALNAIIGGWKVAGTYTFQLGGPLTWLNGSTNNPGDYVYLGGDIKGQPRNIDGNAFDVSRFDHKTADQFQYHIRTFASTFGNVRSDGINEIGGSLQKRWEIGEARSFQVRFEGFNLLNHPVFAAANNTASSSAFGTISSMANKSRSMQVVARLMF